LVPLFIVVGFQKKVYWDTFSRDFRESLRQAINDMPQTGVYIQDEISYQRIKLNNESVIDLGDYVRSVENAYPISLSVDSISDPACISASLNGSVLTLKASAFNIGNPVVKIRAADSNSAAAVIDIFTSVWNPASPPGLIDDFEDGSFAAPPVSWVLSNSGDGARNWTIAADSPYQGVMCARSGAIGEGQSTSMTTTVNYPYTGQIRFKVKASTQPSYDRLELYINNIRIRSWSGEKAWATAIYDVPLIGENTIKFMYIKYDDGISGGTDQVWVDYIEFLNNSQPVTPPAPTLVSPANYGSTYDRTPYFDWNDVSGSTLYDILVDNNSDFSSPEISMNAYSSDFTQNSIILSPGIYYWKTKVTSQAGPYSAVWSFTVKSPAVPDTPSNVSVSVSEGSLFLNWDDSEHAEVYEIYYSATPYGTFSLLTTVAVSEYIYQPEEAKIFLYIIAKNTSR
jgi:hypothetical protein